MGRSSRVGGSKHASAAWVGSLKGGRFDSLGFGESIGSPFAGGETGRS